MSRIKGMIFAAGVGSRLRPLTDRIPKALVEVGGMTMLERTVGRMIEAGVSDIVINVHHHAGQIADFIAAKESFGINIALSDESDRLLDTGGGILKASSLFYDAETVVVHNADIFTDISLCDAISSHQHSGADASLVVARRETSRYLLFDNSWRLRGWENVATGELRPPVLSRDEADRLTRYGFCGIHVIRPATMFPALADYAAADGDCFSMTPFYVSLCDRLSIKACVAAADAVWIDIGRPQTLEAARRCCDNRRSAENR